MKALKIYKVKQFSLSLVHLSEHITTGTQPLSMKAV